MNDLNIYSSDPLLPNLQLARRSQQQSQNEPSFSLIEKIHQIILIWFIYLVNIFKLGYIVWFNVACYLFSFVYQREKSIYNQIVLITGSGGYLGIDKFFLKSLLKFKPFYRNAFLFKQKKADN